MSYISNSGYYGYDPMELGNYHYYEEYENPKPSNSRRMQWQKVKVSSTSKENLPKANKMSCKISNVEVVKSIIRHLNNPPSKGSVNESDFVNKYYGDGRKFNSLWV